MVIVAASDQNELGLIDDAACQRIGTGVICDDKRAAPIVFVGYAAWRRPVSGNADDSDEQVWFIRDSEVGLLEPREDLADHSSAGLSWGCSGTGAAQLSIAILMEVLNDWPRVERIYLEFMDQLVMRIPQGRNWILEGAVVLRIVHRIERSSQPETLT